IDREGAWLSPLPRRRDSVAWPLTAAAASRCAGSSSPSQAGPMADTRLSIRLDLTSGDRIGPGKIAPLEPIGTTGSIAAASRRLGMSYRRGWRAGGAVDDALPEAAVGGRGGWRRARGVS